MDRWHALPNKSVTPSIHVDWQCISIPRQLILNYLLGPALEDCFRNDVEAILVLGACGEVMQNQRTFNELVAMSREQASQR